MPKTHFRDHHPGMTKTTHSANVETSHLQLRPFNSQFKPTQSYITMNAATTTTTITFTHLRQVVPVHRSPEFKKQSVGKAYGTYCAEKKD